MKTSPALPWLAAVFLFAASSAAHAVTLRYSYAGVLNEGLGDLPVGSAFWGSWVMELPQAGTPFTERPPDAVEGRVYRYESFSVRIGGETFSQQTRDLVFVATTDVSDRPEFLPFWPSGFSSDLSVDSGPLFVAGEEPETVFGARVWRVAASFNRDGRLWNDYALPADASLLAQMDGAVLFDTLDRGRVTGAIQSITITPVPLPATGASMGAGLLALGMVGRRQARRS